MDSKTKREWAKASHATRARDLRRSLLAEDREHIRSHVEALDELDSELEGPGSPDDERGADAGRRPERSPKSGR